MPPLTRTMVVRKASIPYPTSPPPPPPPPPEIFGQQSHHHIDSTDIPPVPATTARSNAANNFEDIANPWSDDYSPKIDKSNNLPDLLRPGQSVPAPATPLISSNPSKDLPDILRPGWSGEATPRSSIGSDRSPDKEWWDDDDAALEEEARKQESRPLHVVNDTVPPPQPQPQVQAQPQAQPSLTVKRKPLPQSHSQPELNLELASNNPFRRASETYLEAPTNLPDWASHSSQQYPQDQTAPKSEHPNPLQSHSSTDRLGNLTLDDASTEKILIFPAPTVPPPPPPSQPPPPIPQLQAPLTPAPPPPAPAQVQPPQTYSNDNPRTAQDQPPPTPSPIPFAPSKQHQTVSTDDLLDRGQNNGSISLGDELKALPNAGQSSGISGPTEVSLLDDADEPRPQLPTRPVMQESDDMYAPPPGPPPHFAPVKPPRPAVVTSEHDLARMREQRNETYQIKHFTWYDPTSSRMRRSSMLIQNKNGPCPLLALVNALILGATEEMQAALDDALRLREQVTLGLIIETLMDELLTKAAMTPGLVLPDVDELNRFLMRLRTGMNANPRFAPARSATPNLMDADSTVGTAPPQYGIPAGTFESTSDINLYGSFNVKLLHGWLPRPGDRAAKAFARSAPTYEDAQAVQFGEEELEYKLSHGGLSENEQQVWEDITSIKLFLQMYSTQLTPYGLEALQSTLRPGEFAILFRNDHFSTIYKHPRNQRLFTLITDAGYAERDEVIWESLEDITGARSEFFSGEFASLSQGDSRHPIPHSQTAAANPQRSRTMNAANDIPRALTPQEQQEQHDADFAMALQLQEEEEQRMRQARVQRERENSGSGRGGQVPRNQGPRRSGQGIPIPLRNTPSTNDVRPVIPPRNSQPRNLAVNRPSDANAVDAPPAYEEAARAPMYVPPIGSPLHASSSHDLLGRGSAGTSTSNIHAQGQTTGVTGRGNSHRGPLAYTTQDSEPRPGTHRRRTSAYGENSEHWGHSSPEYSAGAFGPGYAFMSPSGSGADTRRRDPTRRNDEGPCTVM